MLPNNALYRISVTQGSRGLFHSGRVDSEAVHLRTNGTTILSVWGYS